MASEVAAFIGVEERFSGLAGGMIETSREVGGALGVAVVATVAISRTNDVLDSLGGNDASFPQAFTEGSPAREPRRRRLRHRRRPRRCDRLAPR